MIRTLAISAAWLLALTGLSAAPEDYVLHTFDRVQLSDVYFSEGANFGDLNRDGVMDVVYGPFWFAGNARPSVDTVRPSRITTTSGSRCSYC